MAAVLLLPDGGVVLLEPENQSPAEPDPADALGGERVAMFWVTP